MKIKTIKRIRVVLWMVFLLPIVALATVICLVGVFAEIPSFKELENPESNLATALISEDGEIINTYHLENRVYVTYDELPSTLVNAAVATEDVRFYNHSGIDFYSLARVVFKTVLMGDASSGGGSTITQQLAKTLFPREEGNLSIPGGRYIQLGINKFKEWITAVKLERNYTKDEIMTMYMNAIFFGSNAYGIKAAANTYFDKEPSELTLEEGATLIGIVNKPTRYNPRLNYEKSLTRRNHVISQMGKYEYITQQACDSLKQLPITLNYKQQDHNAGIAPYFRDMLRKIMSAKEPKRSSYYHKADYLADLDSWENDPLYGWLNKNFKPDGSKYNLDKDGIKIYTTLNSKMQRYAEQAVEEHLKNTLQPAFFRDLEDNPLSPYSKETSEDLSETLMAQARRWSDRYRVLKDEGASEQEIELSFEKETKMRIFSWNEKGYIDTTMTPNDSIKYYKSILRASFVAMEPQTGAVKAYVGGPNYKYFKYDNVRQGKRQVGSTIKPFLYTLAMQEAYTPCDRVLNVPQSFIVGDTTWTPASTDRADFIGKSVTLKWGLTRSSNNISAYLMKQFGPSAMIDMCRKLGVTTYLAPYPPLCLGSADISLMEMVEAYNTYPSRGVHIEPILVTRIEDNSGNLISTFSPRMEEAISEQTAYLMVNLMEAVVKEGTAGRLRWRYGLRGEVAGKTGTTNDQSDGWFIGYVPKLTAGAWVGGENRHVHFETLANGGGSNTGLPIWGIFMKKVVNDPSLGISMDDRFAAPSTFNVELDCDGSDSDALEGNTSPEVTDEVIEDYFFN